MILEIPKNAETILHILEKAGYEAYVVGGCVRDSILGRSPDDWDITTSAKPEQVKALFHRTVDTGLQHGTVTVLMEKEGYEVTTYRVDGEYEDGRHPKEVTFTASLKEDLKRRDFTINAMAYNPSSGLVDLFGGLEDIERKIIRCVGDPLERFTEDALRIMRAVRFSAQLGFAIEEETRKALKVLAPNLKHVSAERIQVELVKLLMSPHPDYLRVAYEAGITAEFLPEFDACMTTSQNTPHHCYTVGEHILHSLCHVRADKVLRITMLLHDIGKPVVRKTDENGRDHFKMHGIAGEKMAAQILRRLKFDNDTIRKVTRLVKWHDDRPDGTTKAVRRAVNRIGEDLFPYYLEVQQADMLAQSDYRRTEKQERLDKVKEAYETIINEHQCVSLKTLAVTGKDLIEAGYKPGREIGETLNRLLELGVVPIVNENDTVSVTELMFTDNDELSGLVAAMMGAEALVILSNIDGIYDGSPSDPASQVIRRVAPGRDLSQYIDTARSSRGRGGMTTKSRISSRAAGEGIEVVIANGRRDNILTDLILTDRDVVCTRFEAAPRPASGVKKWIASSEGFAKGALHLDAGAAAAVSQSKAASILAVGVTAVEGDFERDDIVRILSPEGAPLGVGRISCDSATARRNLGRKGLKPLIHCDYLYLE